MKMPVASNSWDTTMAQDLPDGKHDKEISNGVVCIAPTKHVCASIKTFRRDVRGPGHVKVWMFHGLESNKPDDILIER